jgi:hypothetical protein
MISRLLARHCGSPYLDGPAAAPLQQRIGSRKVSRTLDSDEEVFVATNRPPKSIDERGTPNDVKALVKKKAQLSRKILALKSESAKIAEELVGAGFTDYVKSW